MLESTGLAGNSSLLPNEPPQQRNTPLPGHPRPPPSSAESDGATSRLGQRPPSSLDEPELEKILEDLGALGLNEDAGSSEMMNG